MGGNRLLVHPLGASGPVWAHLLLQDLDRWQWQCLAWGQDETGSFGHAQLPRECSRLGGGAGIREGAQEWESEALGSDSALPLSS